MFIFAFNIVKYPQIMLVSVIATASLLSLLSLAEKKGEKSTKISVANC